MTESPGSLVLMRPWMKLEFGSEAAVVVAGLVFTGLSSLELWRGDLEAVRLFSRLFVLFLLFDALFIADISERFLFYYIPKYALTLLPILVLVPFYQRRLALRILAAGSTESIRDGAKSR